MADTQQTIIDEVIKLLQGGSAHAGLDDALDNLPPEQRGVKPHNLPYSIWQLVEHIRIAQWDMLAFSKDSSHKSPKWPDEYWPQEAAPASEEVWNQSIQQIKSDLNALIDLVKTRNIYEPIPHGDGQNILREALQAADHTAYHVAEIILLRRLLGSWKS
ncbi:DinB family protein [Mucilaginibacter sp. Bleaf8]|uniref:DinB family protein n=1 Tax=Mucilaginibacter sp. Bleaf8 TaxID=2834430 RepID=UPI001BCF01D0|nr:DinB family protein [Mucilaginibacter sp. Bleaf8]MBS7564022.1 DinB family protein [Mucilaginibacter sp. Bleaf8]